MVGLKILRTALAVPILVASLAMGASPGEPQVKTPNLAGNIDRPLRYRPEGKGFLIVDGNELFNRPLYGGNTAFRVDAGDRPQFGFYLPGRGGLLRLGIRTTLGMIWLDLADHVIARYGPGYMAYQISDPAMADARLTLTAIPLRRAQGLAIQVQVADANGPIELIWSFGGANGQRGRRGVDIGAEPQPVGLWWQLRPEYCADNRFTIEANRFRLDCKQASIFGIGPEGSSISISDANGWSNIEWLLQHTGRQARYPVLVGRSSLQTDDNAFIVIQVGRPPDPDPAAIFRQAQQDIAQVANRLVIDTPDPFINAAACALNIAADAIWDEPSGTVMHGAVAWRSRLLGWRGPYANDALGWHERARRHILYWASRQNTSPVPQITPGPDESAKLSRCEAALHSNGDISNSHYDMNLVYIDMVLRHLLWTGDLGLARSLWPVIERHLAWERRLFRRPYGPDGLPLYEAYACFWASDDIGYNGAGTAVASAYNYWHNLMAARLARLIGKDPGPYEREAHLIKQAMKRYLWLAEKGWHAEYRDLLGLQLAHESPGLWSFYHCVDCNVPSAFEAWQASRFVDTQIAHIPVRGPGVPPGQWFTLATTNWMPYAWSTNNVVMAESMHTALAYWQSGRPDEAWLLFKGAILDSMYMGLCPGNLGMCTGYDVYRRECQRDFADAIGVTARALVEGLFGIMPDALEGRILVRPGFPRDWAYARIRHPSISYTFRRNGNLDTHLVEPNMTRPQSLRLQVMARSDTIAVVRWNGRPAAWQLVQDAIGAPIVEIMVPLSPVHEVVIQWDGRPISHIGGPSDLAAGQLLQVEFTAGRILGLHDPQAMLDQVSLGEDRVSGVVRAQPGHHCLFLHLQQGQVEWWEPVNLRVAGQHTESIFTIPQDPNWQTLDISGLFNARLTDIFKAEYLSPRSPYCSLSTPRHGIGSWCRPDAKVDIDDSGLRGPAARTGLFLLPSGLPFATPGPGEGKNVCFLSQWDNYPDKVTIGLGGKGRRIYLLMAGTTGPMQSRFDNGEVIIEYADGSCCRLALHNPTNWWPIDQDYFIDDFQFSRPGPIPPRLYLKTGEVRIQDTEGFKGKGGPVDGGAATILDMPIDPTKELRSMTVRVLANEVVIGLLAVTLAR